MSLFSYFKKAEKSVSAVFNEIAADTPGTSSSSTSSSADLSVVEKASVSKSIAEAVEGSGKLISVFKRLCVNFL